MDRIGSLGKDSSDFIFFMFWPFFHLISAFWDLIMLKRYLKKFINMGPTSGTAPDFNYSKKSRSYLPWKITPNIFKNVFQKKKTIHKSKILSKIAWKTKCHPPGAYTCCHYSYATSHKSIFLPHFIISPQFIKENFFNLVIINPLKYCGILCGILLRDCDRLMSVVCLCVCVFDGSNITHNLCRQTVFMFVVSTNRT